MKIVFIGCGAKKRKEACKAKDMYIGPLFVKALQYASTLNIDPHKDELVFLCGVKYYKYLLDNIGNPSNVVLPYKDCKGIGYILQFLNNTLK